MASVPVVVVAGLHARARGEVVRALLSGVSHSAAVHHDLRGGRVARVVLDAWGVRGRADVPLAHGCVPCTVRDDAPRALLGLAHAASLLVLEIWGALETRPIVEEIARTPGLRPAAVLTAVDASALPHDIACDERLGDRPPAAVDDDDRYVAEVLARQIEYASGLVLVPADDPDDTALAARVLDHLGAGLPVTALPELTAATPAGRVDPAALAAQVHPATVRLPCDRDSGDVVTVVWRRLRPLHPVRFHDAIEDVAGAAVRSRGRMWLASRPGTLLAWDCVAGLLAIEDRGPWLAARPTAWAAASPARRAATALDWRPGLGDRTQLIAFTGGGIDRAALFGLLDRCLLTDEEMLAGATAWESYADPFAAVLD
ncbi:GTP-binding protein [Actinomadura miaoliensis]|uniref:GTP-binding protein n=1 Tax=Actinomadura miaoliensis TaxID=430685 RepID=A0ABP7VDC3_9ACTN